MPPFILFLALGLFLRPTKAIQLLVSAPAWSFDGAFGYSDGPEDMTDRRRDDGLQAEVLFCDTYNSASEAPTCEGTCDQWWYPAGYKQWAARVDLTFLPACFTAPSNMNMFACPQGATHPQQCTNSTMLYNNDQAWNDSDNGQYIYEFPQAMSFLAAEYPKIWDVGLFDT